MRMGLFLAMVTLIAPLLWGDMLQEIVNKKRLDVCIWPEYYGISYVEPRTQTLIGIDVDMAYAFAKELGVEAHFIQSSFATLIHDVSTKRCDIAMFAIGHTPERRAHLELTTPHLQSDIYAITTKSNRRIQSWDDIDQKGVVVAVAKGTYHVEVMRERLKHATLLITQNLHAREKEVESGRADLFMTDFPFGVRMVKERDWAKLISPPYRFHTTPYGWALPKNEAAWKARVESFIAAIKRDGRLEQAAKRHGLEPIVFLE